MVETGYWEVGAMNVAAVMEVRVEGLGVRREIGLQQKQHGGIDAPFEWLDLDKCNSDIV